MDLQEKMLQHIAALGHEQPKKQRRQPPQQQQWVDEQIESWNHPPGDVDPTYDGGPGSNAQDLGPYYVNESVGRDSDESFGHDMTGDFNPMGYNPYGTGELDTESQSGLMLKHKTDAPASADAAGSGRPRLMLSRPGSDGV